jgi:hypothetical protein
MKFFSSVIALSIIAVSATAAPAKFPAGGHRATKALPDIDIRSPAPRTGNRGLTTSPQIGTRANTNVNPDAVTDTTCLDPTVYVPAVPHMRPLTLLSVNSTLMTRTTPSSPVGLPFSRCLAWPLIISSLRGIAGAIQFCEGDPYLHRRRFRYLQIHPRPRCVGSHHHCLQRPMGRMCTSRSGSMPYRNLHEHLSWWVERRRRILVHPERK